MSNTNKQRCATIICNGRPALTRRAKYLVKLLKTLVPDDVLAYVECEFCAETRHHQNTMADAIFLAHMLISYIDPFRLNSDE